MLPISIVILTRNEERNIARCISPLVSLTDDILLIDNGSTDQTIAIAESMGAKVMKVEWQGYAQTKNNGNQYAKYNWILSLDADEEMNDELKESLISLFAGEVNEFTAYSIKRKLVYEGKILHHGCVSNEYRLRLFNKKNAAWNQEEVHEDIIFDNEVKVDKLKGFLWHHSYANKEEHLRKLEHYARLFANQHKRKGNKVNYWKMLFSPVFGFIKNYFFRLGFLDGLIGFRFAKEEMIYTYTKYRLAAQ